MLPREERFDEIQKACLLMEEMFILNSIPFHIQIEGCLTYIVSQLKHKDFDFEFLENAMVDCCVQAKKYWDQK